MAVIITAVITMSCHGPENLSGSLYDGAKRAIDALQTMEDKRDDSLVLRLAAKLNAQKAVDELDAPTVGNDHTRMLFYDAETCLNNLHEGCAYRMRLKWIGN